MSTEAEAAESASRIIDSFGGIRPMATKLAVPVTTVQGWKKRGIIPQPRHADILAVANREGIALDPTELAATDTGIGSRVETRTFEPAVEAPPDVAEPARPAFAPPPIAPPAIAPPPIGPQPVVVRRGGGVAYTALLVSLLVAAGVAGAGYVAWQYYYEPLKAKVAVLEARPGGGASDELVRRVAKLEADIAQASASPAAAGAAPVSADGDRLAALEKQMAELKAGSDRTEQLAKNLSDMQVAAGGRELLAQSIRDIQSSTAATQGEVERLGAQITALGARLDQVDTALADKRQQALRAEAAVLAVGQLRTALATSKPFAKELAALRALAGGDGDMAAAMDRIEPFADTGVPTYDELSKDFARLAPILVRSAVVGDGQSWWRQALYHIETVVSVRRVGENTPGDATDAVVARAEGKVDENDLPGAIAALKGLTGLPAEMASSWVHDAANRVTIEAAADNLTETAIAHVGAGAPPPGPAAAAPATAK